MRTNINLKKYFVIVFLISVCWSFIGGIIIAHYGTKGYLLGVKVFFLGGLFTFFLFSYIVKKGKFVWILNDNKYEEKNKIIN